MDAKRHESALRWIAGALIGLTGVSVAIALFVHTQRASYIGETDGANTVVVARNLVEGRGFTVDYVAMHLRSYDAVHHPEDSFPLLHPALIAGVALVTGDVVTATHLFGALLLAVYLVGLPWLALRWWGVVPATVLWAGLLAQEGLGTYFARPLNDPAAMVMVGASAILLVRAIELPDGRSARRALAGCAVLAATATQLKLSAAFFVLAECAALLALDRTRPRRDRVRRAVVVAAAAVVAHVPVLVWHAAVFGSPGVPQNALGRNIARACGMEDDFWRCFDRTRVWLPAHPEFLVTTGQWIARDGIVGALVVAPIQRMAVGFVRAVVRGEVLPLAWLALLSTVALGRTGSARVARLALLATLFALALPAYSHYEPRYLHPVRPFLALAGAFAARDALAGASTGARARVGAAAVALSMLAVAWGATHAWWWQAGSVHALAVAVGAAAAVGYVMRPADDGWRERVPRALQGGAALGLAFGFAVLASNGVRRLLEPVDPDRDRALGAWIASATPPNEVLLANRLWSLSFWSRRAFVKIPYHAEDVCSAAARYRATAILVEPADLVLEPELTRFLSPESPVAERMGVAIRHLHCAEEP